MTGVFLAGTAVRYAGARTKVEEYPRSIAGHCVHGHPVIVGVSEDPKYREMVEKPTYVISCHVPSLSLHSQLALRSDFVRENHQLVDHVVDGVDETEHLAGHGDGPDCLGQVSSCDCRLLTVCRGT